MNELTSSVVLGVSFNGKAGEILGLAGLPGSGAEETLDLLYGRDAPISGTIQVAGAAARFASPRGAVAAGLSVST
ncbi:MAG: ATP-binding cassette domain-containing protein [Burkholderiales bacterium]